MMGRHGHRGLFAVPDEWLSLLELKEGETVVDVGSGPGRFSIPIAKVVGPSGKVYAIDIDEQSLDEVKRRASEEGLTNVVTVRADATKGLPLPAGIADLVLMANVLHGFVHSGRGPQVLSEAARVLKGGGRLAVFDFAKRFMAFGPPLWIRVSPEEVIELAAAAGFELSKRVDDVGHSHYFLMFRKP